MGKKSKLIVHKFIVRLGGIDFYTACYCPLRCAENGCRAYKYGLAAHKTHFPAPTLPLPSSVWSCNCFRFFRLICCEETITGRRREQGVHSNVKKPLKQILDRTFKTGTLNHSDTHPGYKIVN